MIIIEDIGNGRVRRYSDKGVLLHKINTSEYYLDPVDMADAPWTYEESNIRPEPEPVEEDII